jgi:hypothetical protein
VTALPICACGHAHQGGGPCLLTACGCAYFHHAVQGFASRTGHRFAFDTRIPLGTGREVTLHIDGPLTDAEFRYLMTALADLRPGLTSTPRPTIPADAPDPTEGKT